MTKEELVAKLRQRQAELRERLEAALERATTPKAQYKELDRLLAQDGLGELAERIQRLRQSKLAENAAAVEEVRSLLARLQVHEELLAALGEVSGNGAERR